MSSSCVSTSVARLRWTVSFPRSVEAAHWPIEKTVARSRSWPFSNYIPRRFREIREATFSGILRAPTAHFSVWPSLWPGVSLELLNSLTAQSESQRYGRLVEIFPPSQKFVPERLVSLSTLHGLGSKQSSTAVSTDTADLIFHQWVPEIKGVCPGVPFLVIGCKNDLRTDSALQLYLTVPGQKSPEPDSVNKLKVRITGTRRDTKETCFSRPDTMVKIELLSHNSTLP